MTSATRASLLASFFLFSLLFASAVSTLECTTCKLLVPTIADAIVRGNNATVIALTQQLCYSVLHAQDKTVCDGIGDAFVPEVLGVLEQAVSQEAGLLCFKVGLCATAPPSYKGWNMTFPKQKPPFVPPVYPSPSASPAYNVLHLTDIHLDKKYQTGAPVHCGEPICCRSRSPRIDNSSARALGEYSCDLNPRMLDFVLTNLSTPTEGAQYKILLWTGDSPPHFVWNQTQQGVLSDTVWLSNRLRQSIPPGVVVIPAVGNHESFPVDNFGDPSLQKWLYTALADAWADWLPASAVQTLRAAGYYSVVLPPTVPGGNSLKIISVQTNYCNNYAFYLYLNDTDPGQQLEWLINELQASEDDGAQSVWLVGHIPPTNNNCLKPWSARFMKILDRYEGVVAGMFYGHTHKDSFALDGDAPVQFIAPSVTTMTDINPSWRYYRVSPQKHLVIDHSTYHVDLDATYQSPTMQPVAKLFYTASQAYGMSDLSPQSWLALAESFATNDTLFQQYVQHKYTGRRTEPCTGKCKESEICQIFSNCTKALMKMEKTLC